MKSKKILICLLMISLLSFYISNYSTIYTIDDLAYVIGIGFDTSDNNVIKLSLQVAVPSSHGSEGKGGSSQSEASIVKTVECKTVSDGINLINSYIGKKLNLAYCKVIVFSKDIPSKNIINYSATLLNDVEVRPYCSVLLSKCEASYFLENSEPLLEKLSSKYYNSSPSPEQTTGYVEHINLIDFYSDYYDTFGEPSAILGGITSDGEKGHIESLGLAAFHNGTLTGELTGNETIYHLIITNRLQNTVLSIPNPFNDSQYIALSIDSAHTKSRAKIVNGFPYITCKVKLNTRVLSSSINSDYLDKENIKKIEEYANSYFKANIENYLYKTSITLKSDIAKFGKYGVRNFLTWDKWKEYDWLNKYSNSTFNVSVDTHLKSSYLVVGINNKNLNY